MADDRSWVEKLKCWYQDLVGIQRVAAALPVNKELMERIERALPKPMSKAMAEAALQEARSIYDHRDARLARVESRATTLQATVGIAATLVLATGALLLDPKKVTDDGARYALAGLGFLLILTLVVTGWFAARATLKRRPRRQLQMLERFEEEQQAHAPLTFGRPMEEDEARVAHHLRHQVIDLLVATERSEEIDLQRTWLLMRARAWYQLALVLLAIFAATMGYFAATLEPAA
jgi:hypothetical protein